MAQQHPNKQPGESSLKGTLVSVLLLGLFLVLVWVGVFALFASRNG
ncbi:cytochrome c oxidase subunit 2A [Paenibacillus koleovorans]|nr:cytochrome c oxidase subunit 2A [Paenibacillus koleovorans]